MQSRDDTALLREFAETNSEDAFSVLVTRHVNLVYSVAMRSVGNPASAEEITQAVFIILARKAGQLRNVNGLSGWLFQTTRLTANNFLRSEMRRQHREQEAHDMQTILNEPEPESELWPRIAPLLDGAVAALNEKDRHAILLRFYEDKNLREIGTVIGASEAATEKRVNRALEKLRKFFAKRGVSSTAAVIAGTISANSIQAAPAVLAKSVTTLAIAKGAAASASTLTLIKGALKIMAWTKAKTAIVIGVSVLLAAGTATELVKKTPYIQSLPVFYAAQADPRVLDLLKRAQMAADDAKTLTADFTYTTQTPNGNKMDVSKDVGTVKLMKPNFADIQFNVQFNATSRWGQHIVSDGTNLWKYHSGTRSYSREDADPDGKNVTVWRLIIIGGFFDVETWIHKGIYVGSPSELTYVGVETVGGVQYQVLEHRMIGTMKGKAVPFDQKIYIGPDNLIHRFTLDFTVDGKPGSEMAELTNIRTGEAFAPADFVFVPPPGSKEVPATP